MGWGVLIQPLLYTQFQMPALRREEAAVSLLLSRTQFSLLLIKAERHQERRGRKRDRLRLLDYFKHSLYSLPLCSIVHQFRLELQRSQKIFSFYFQGLLFSFWIFLLSFSFSSLWCLSLSLALANKASPSVPRHRRVSLFRAFLPKEVCVILPSIALENIGSKTRLGWSFSNKKYIYFFASEVSIITYK